MRGAVLAVLAACSSPTPSNMVDAGQGPIAYSLYVGRQPGTRTVLPQIFIDGTETQSVQRTYPDLATANAFRHTVELRYGAQQLIALVETFDTTDCTFHVPGPVEAIEVGMIALDSGDLRYGGDTVHVANGACSGDGFGIARCGCSNTERCAPRITLADPLFTKMACMPIGPKQVGEACSFTPDADGAYDDCGAELVCYAGTCHSLCNVTSCATTCVQPDGYPSEATLCM